MEETKLRREEIIENLRDGILVIGANEKVETTVPSGGIADLLNTKLLDDVKSFDYDVLNTEDSTNKRQNALSFIRTPDDL